MARTMLGCWSPWIATPSRWRLRTYCGSVGIFMATNWSVQTWWWARQTSPNVPPPIFSSRTYSLMRWFAFGIAGTPFSICNVRLRRPAMANRKWAIANSLSLHSFRQPVAGQQIIDAGEQGTDGKEGPRRGAGQGPVKQPGEEQSFDQSVREDQGPHGGVGIETGDPSDQGKRHTGIQKDQAE